jgi:Holliday junction resolvase-like predicted endonuclease
MSGGGNKRKGKRGEKGAHKFLTDNGWYIANTEVQGLAGDDIFARDPSGKWWSVEVKNCTAYHPKFISQAKKQAKERKAAIAHKMGNSPQEAEVMEFLGMGSFTARDWLVMWHPSNSDCRAHCWALVRKADGGNGWNDFISPWDGVS